MTKKFAVSDVYCHDATKSAYPISTGIGYLDHMIDQLNSHAQVGVSVTVIVVGNDDDDDDDAPPALGKHGEEGGDDDDDGRRRRRRHPPSEFINRYANEDQFEILSLVGSALGERLGALLSAGRTTGAVVGSGSRFRCPLDEALVECTLTTTTTTTTSTTTNGKGEEEGGGGRLVDFTLPPYGIYPPDGIGRTKIGCLETRHVTSFFDALARSSGLHISLVKVRGDNGHHVIESAYKAFSRAFRNLLDGTDAYYVGSYDPLGYEAAWYRGTTTTTTAAATTGSPSSSSTTSRREGRVERSTKETSISVYVRLSGGGGGLPEVEEEEEEESAMTIRVDTGIRTLDRFVSILAREADMCVDVACTGDLYVDDHHTSEDVSIALGQALDTALGTRAGLNRMWCAVGTYGGEFTHISRGIINACV